MIIGHGNCFDFNFRTEFSDGSKDSGPLGAICHAVGSILHIAPAENFSIREHDGGPDSKVRVGRMGVLHHSRSGLFQRLSNLAG